MTNERIAMMMMMSGDVGGYVCRRVEGEAWSPVGEKQRSHESCVTNGTQGPTRE